MSKNRTCCAKYNYIYPNKILIELAANKKANCLTI